jgi:hypothetical protein
VFLGAVWFYFGFVRVLEFWGFRFRGSLGFYVGGFLGFGLGLGFQGFILVLQRLRLF